MRPREIAQNLARNLVDSAGVPAHVFRIAVQGRSVNVEYITKAGHYKSHMYASEGHNGVMRLVREISQRYRDHKCDQSY